MGDNITPPQQAFNWVADVYGSTEEIKARGQVIVGLLHQDIGHLGIFVSGKVAKKEHAQIVSVLESIEALPAGLYGMQILERRGADGRVQYDVQFVEHRLEEVVGRLNRFKRVDEKPFEAVEAVSEFGQRAYELFAQPLVQATSSEPVAKLGRAFHPLRLQRWALSDAYNPWLWWLGPMADAVRTQRKAGADPGSARAATPTATANPWLTWLRPWMEATKVPAPGVGDVGGMLRTMAENNPWLGWLRSMTEAGKQPTGGTDMGGLTRMMTENNPWAWWLRSMTEAGKGQPTGAADMGGLIRTMTENNPWAWWLRSLTETAGTRPPAAGDVEPARRIERMMAEATSATLDYYRDVRDAMSEAAFFLTYGNLFSFYLADRRRAEERGPGAAAPADPRELPFVKEALASLEQGGYAEAVARVAALINREGERIPLARLELRRDLAQDYAEFLPAIPREQMRRIRGEQDIIVRYEPERALATLPKLLADPADRKRLLTFAERLLGDERARARKFTAEDLARIDAILGVLGETPLRLAVTTALSA
jgi:hypothetical protein